MGERGGSVHPPTAVASSGGPGAVEPETVEPCRTRAAPVPPVPPRLASASPVPFWLDSPHRPEAAAAARAAATAPTWSSSAAATPGCGPRCSPRTADPGRDVVLLEARARRLGGVPGATAASARPPSPTASATGSPGCPRSCAADPARAREPATASRRHDRAIRHRLRRSSDRRAGRRDRAVPGRRAARSCRELAAPYGDELEFLDARRGPGRRCTRRPTSARLLDRDGVAMVDPARLAWGLRRVALAARGADLRGHPARDLERRRRRAARRHRAPDGGVGRPPAGSRWPPTRSRRCCAALRHYLVPVYDYVLVTEPLTRRAAGTRSAGPGRQGIGDSGNQFHYYRLHRRRPDPVRRLRRDLPLGGGMSARRSTSGPRRSRMLAEHFVETFPQLEGVALQPRAGAARSTPAAGSARSGARRTAAGSRTPPATPGSASGRPGSVRAVMLDLLDGRRTERTATAMRPVASRCRSRPSRCGAPASS